MLRTPEQQREYDSYLCSGTWRQKRQAALERDNHRCRLCNGSKGLQVHHRTYENTWGNGLGNEPIEDLTTLCSGCHNRFHGGGPKRQAASNGKGKKARKKQRKQEALRGRKVREKKEREHAARTKDRSPRPVTQADIEALAQQMNAHLRPKQRRGGNNSHADALS